MSFKAVARVSKQAASFYAGKNLSSC